MMLAAVLLWLAPAPQVVEDRCCLIEINHVVSGDTGEESFVQLIAWEFSPFESRFHVQDWRFLKRNEHAARSGAMWRVTFQDSSDVWRTVTAPAYRETFTTYDPETAERDVLPSCKRRGFSK